MTVHVNLLHAEIGKLKSVMQTLEHEKTLVELELKSALLNRGGSQGLSVLQGHRVLLVGGDADLSRRVFCHKYHINLVVSDEALRMRGEADSDFLMDFDLLLLRRHFVDHAYEAQLQSWCMQYGVAFSFVHSNSLGSFIGALDLVGRNRMSFSYPPTAVQCIRHA